MYQGRDSVLAQGGSVSVKHRGKLSPNNESLRASQSSFLQGRNWNDWAQVLKWKLVLESGEGTSKAKRCKRSPANLRHVPVISLRNGKVRAACKPTLIAAKTGWRALPLLHGSGVESKACRKGILHQQALSQR